MTLTSTLKTNLRNGRSPDVILAQVMYPAEGQTDPCARVQQTLNGSE